MRGLRWIPLAMLSWTVAAQTVRYGVGLDGVPVTALARPETKIVVLFFAASDCPISNRYIPELARLEQEFESKGAQFWRVYPNPGDTAEMVRQRMTKSDDAGVVLDTEQSLTRMAGASITPEAAVFVRDGNNLREVYRGRIDDRYLALGSERPRAFHHDLEDAIAAAVKNKPAPQPGGPAVGCAIVTRQP